MEGVDLYNTPYLHPKLNDHDNILTKELGYGYCIGALGGFAYHMLPQPEPPAALSPLTARLCAAISQKPLGDYTNQALAKSRDAIAGSPLLSEINAAVMKSRFLGKSGSAAAESPLLAQLKAAIRSTPLGETVLGKSAPAAAVSTELRARFMNAITKAPMVGIQVGGWVALRAFIEYKMADYRGKVDSDNSFVSGAIVGGLAAAYYRLPIFASALILGSAVGTFDCACDSWYFKNNGRVHKSHLQLD